MATEEEEDGMLEWYVVNMVIEAFRREKNLKRCEMGEKNCHVCQQKENKSQKLYCDFLFIYICLIVAPEMYLFDV